MAIEVSAEPAAFADFERQGWESQIAAYDKGLGRISRQTVEPTLDAAGVRAGMKVLDLCCGPGILAEAAVRRGADVVGLDFPEVVRLAASLVAGATFRSGDAQELPFDDNAFDAVVCGYGILHVPDPGRMLGEIRRVLCPGGRAALSSWDVEAPDAGLALIYGAVRKHAHFNIGLPHGPDVFQFSTRDKMAAALNETGFAESRAISVPQVWEVASGKELLDAIHDGTVRTRAVLAAQSPETLDLIVATVEAPFIDQRQPDGRLEVPFPAILGSGTKPGM